MKTTDKISPEEVDQKKTSNMKRKLMCIGDTHGDDGVIMQCAKQHPGSNLIHVGDFGIGFKELKKEQQRVDILNECLKANQCSLYIIRGNHDDPSYWLDKKVMTECVHFVPDYTTLTLSGKKILFNGGGVSVDRWARAEGVSWWRNEGMTFPERLRKQKVDILISHTGPAEKYASEKLGSIQHHIDKDDKLWARLDQEKVNINLLETAVSSPLWICGHMHISKTVKQKNRKIVFLDINEIIELP